MKILRFSHYLMFVMMANISPSVYAGVTIDKLDDFVKHFYQEGQFNGVVLVSKDTQVIFEKGYGFANLEKNIKNTPDTKFRIGSITKQFTAMLIMQLVQEGKINLNSPISQYIKKYRKDTGDKVTIHQLLTHTSGIPSYTDLPYFKELISKNSYSVDEFTKLYCSDDLEFEPGSQFKYSNSGYFLLGNIIEKVTGQSYATVLREKILNPLDMENSGYDDISLLLKNRAEGYKKTANNYARASYLDMSIPYAAGAMYSTTHDLMLWDAALYSDKLIDKKLINKMYQTTSQQNYGYGWSVDEIPKVKYGKELTNINHGGAISGFRTYISRIIQDKYLIILLNNTNNASLDEINTGIIDILYGKYPEINEGEYDDFTNNQDHFGKWKLARNSCPLKYRIAEPRYNNKLQKYKFLYQIKYYGNGSAKIQYELGNKSGKMKQTLHFKDRDDDKSGISIGFDSTEQLYITNCVILTK